MVEVDIGIKIPGNIHLAIVEKELMFTGYVDIGIRPDTLPPINQVAVVDF